MRISDWSSDVCSSDLGLELPRAAVGAATGRVGEHDLGGEGGARDPVGPGEEHPGGERGLQRRGRGIGTDVLHEVELRSEHRALVVEGHAGQAVLVAGLAGRHEVLAPDRKSVVTGKSGSVSVSIGGRPYLKKKTK